ncbi:hypothetical protein RRG08_013191 [Elysia crispata]|uniref:Uncharacterized protein n=1 Tax=Elysia crispata TaxID=231223 RepID=A0AAE1B5L4_9GAST|nr:hypothetical protein RRG08_013191 [Elysia crispata]
MGRLSRIWYHWKDVLEYVTVFLVHVTVSDVTVFLVYMTVSDGWDLQHWPTGNSQSVTCQNTSRAPPSPPKSLHTSLLSPARRYSVPFLPVTCFQRMSDIPRQEETVQTRYVERRLFEQKLDPQSGVKTSPSSVCLN